MNRLRQLLEPLIACVQSAVTRKWDSIKFRDEMRRAVEQSCGGVKDWDAFARRLSFVSGDATSAPHEGCAALAGEIARFIGPGDPRQPLVSSGRPPALFDVIAARLGTSGLAMSDHGWRRRVVEKPFGEDRASARRLDRQLRDVFGEDQIYRGGGQGSGRARASTSRPTSYATCSRTICFNCNVGRGVDTTTGRPSMETPVTSVRRLRWQARPPSPVAGPVGGPTARM